MVVLSRPLSFAENFYRARTVSDFYNNFQVTATYSQNLEENVQVVYQALRKTILENHILVCNVARDGSMGGGDVSGDVAEYLYHPLRQVRFGDVVEVQREPSYIDNDVTSELFMKYVNSFKFKLGSDTALFQLRIVDGIHLSASFEHTIADGMSANYFHDKFLSNLRFCHGLDQHQPQFDELNVGFSSDTVWESTIFDFERDRTSIKNPLPPPMDWFFDPIELDYAFDDPQFFDKQIPEGFYQRWKGRGPGVNFHSLSFKLINFTPAETKTILAKCKKEKVSLTAYIELVLALTLQPLFGDDVYTTFKVAMSVRRHLRPELVDEPYNSLLNQKDLKIIGTMAHLGITENHPPVKHVSWDRVRVIHDHLQQASGNNRLMNFLYPFKKFCQANPDPSGYFKAQLGEEKLDSVKISNIGLLQTKEHELHSDHWTITNAIFSQYIHGVSSDFLLNVISTSLGGLNFVLSYDDSSFDDTPFESFDGFVQALKVNVLENL